MKPRDIREDDLVPGTKIIATGTVVAETTSADTALVC